MNNFNRHSEGGPMAIGTTEESQERSNADSSLRSE